MKRRYQVNASQPCNFSTLGEKLQFFGNVESKTGSIRTHFFQTLFLKWKNTKLSWSWFFCVKQKLKMSISSFFQSRRKPIIFPSLPVHCSLAKIISRSCERGVAEEEELMSQKKPSNTEQLLLFSSPEWSLKNKLNSTKRLSSIRSYMLRCSIKSTSNGRVWNMAIRSLRYTLQNVKVGKKPTQEKLKLKSNPPSTNDGNPLLHPLPHRTYLRLQRNVTGFRRQPFRGIKWKTVRGIRNSLFNSAYSALAFVATINPLCKRRLLHCFKMFSYVLSSS